MVLKNNPLSGEDRRVVSTRLYSSELIYFKKICDKENTNMNKKIRKMIREEIKNKFGDVLEARR